MSVSKAFLVGDCVHLGDDSIFDIEDIGDIFLPNCPIVHVYDVQDGSILIVLFQEC